LTEPDTLVRILVLGGIRSGKSQWAESAIAKSVDDGAVVRYLATGPDSATDAEWSARVDAHRRRRPAS
jgi:adenosylcobinamide kinase / adenosylcobinamide-phosphate guanylyltransferase